MLQLSQGGNISILQSHRLRLFFWKRCTVLNLFFNLANWKNAHDPGEVDENRSFLVVSLHDRFSGWSFLGSMRTVSETAHTKKNLSLIVCLSLKWSVKWFRIADFKTIVRKLDRFINHTVFSVAIYEVWFRSLTIMTQLLLSGFFPRHWYISVASPWVTWWEVEMVVERWVERGEQGKYWALL